MKDYRVDLDVYNGPLDLLLFLIRRDEIDVYDIPIARVTRQYVEYVNVLKHIDPDMVGDFLVMAATLMEIKSRMLLPTPPPEEETQEDFGDPRLQLVRQLLEYKSFKDAARSLDASMQIQALKHPRIPVDALPSEDQTDLDDVQVWDLLDAFQKVLEATGRKDTKHEVVYDDTPIALHAADILDALQRTGGRHGFQNLFAGRDKGQMIGLFLALLELIRRRRIRAVQSAEFATIELELLDDEPIDVDESDYASQWVGDGAAEAIGDPSQPPEADHTVDSQTDEEHKRDSIDAVSETE